MARKLVLDVDTGTDDAVAIMLAALHPALELLAVTTVNGNVEVAHCTNNTLRTLEWIGRADIPVYEGLAHPIVRSDFPVARATKRDAKVHMEALPLPEPKGRKQKLPAPLFLTEVFAQNPGEITLVAVGPLSNVAAAIALDPAFVGNVAELMIMGGAIDKSNVTPSAEFNIWADPEAAAIVFEAGFEKITLVLLDATHRALISRAHCEQLDALGTPAGQAAASFIGHRITVHDEHQKQAVPHTTPVHDALAVGSLVQPELITTRRLHVAVETKGELTIGRTVIDTHFRGGRTPNCTVAFDADAAGFADLLLRTFAAKA